MNVQQARQSLKHFGTEGAVVPVTLGRDQTRTITLARDGVGIHRINGAFLSWTREEAITAARAIVEYYDEPVCIRKKGSGIAQ